MERFATITSASGGALLKFSNVTDDAFTVILEGPDFSGSAHVSSYHSGFPNRFFEELSTGWRGWPGEKKWESLEGELVLIAKSDKLGHIFLTASIGVTNGRDDWNLKGHLLLEAGNLEPLSRTLNKLFSEAKFQIDT